MPNQTHEGFYNEANALANNEVTLWSERDYEVANAARAQALGDVDAVELLRELVDAFRGVAMAAHGGWQGRFPDALQAAKDFLSTAALAGDPSTQPSRRAAIETPEPPPDLADEEQK